MEPLDHPTPGSPYRALPSTRWSKIHRQGSKPCRKLSMWGKDFARQFRVVRNNTLQIAEDIPESSTASCRRPTAARLALC